MSAFLGAVSWAALVAGGVFCIIGGIGLIRLPRFYSRLHGGGIVDTMGSGLILFGLALQAGWTLVTFKLALLFFVALLAGPTSTHALSKAALRAGVKPMISEGGDEPSN